MTGDGRGPGFAVGEEQVPLSAETLDQSSGDDTGFFCDVGEGEARRAEALHDAGGGSEEFLVGGFAGARGHGVC